MNVPALVTKLIDMGQTVGSIASAIGVSRNVVKHWKFGRSKPSFEDGRALLVLALRVFARKA